MHSFKSFLVEARGKMTASGVAGEDHLKKYVMPHLGSKDFTHTLATEHEDLPAGSSVKLKSVERINGKIHVNAEDQTGNHQLIPISKLHKPGVSCLIIFPVQDPQMVQTLQLKTNKRILCIQVVFLVHY
jgi:hypothetical protein